MTTRCKLCFREFPYVSFGGNTDEEIEYQERNFICSECRSDPANAEEIY